MVIQNFLEIPGKMDVESISNAQIYNIFILTLPFRIRTGTLFTVRLDDSFEVIFRNKLNIPRGIPREDIWGLLDQGDKHRPYEHFFTEAYILDKHPPIDTAYREKFAKYVTTRDSESVPRLRGREYEAFTFLNDVIVGYHHSINNTLGGTFIKRLSLHTFYGRLRYIYTVISPSGYQISESALIEILDTLGEQGFMSFDTPMFSFEGLDDISDAQKSNIQHYSRLHQRFLFYQFALDAKARMIELDYISAIIFAVVALEGVHAVLLRMRLYRQLTQSIMNPEVRARQAETTAERLLRDVGFYETLDMTILLFLKPEERPTPEEIKKCKEGITYRNDIMHALVNNRGQYRLRNRTNAQISDAYGNVLKIFNHFAMLVERDPNLENMPTP
jgi:hypothetical protein